MSFENSGERFLSSWKYIFDLYIAYPTASLFRSMNNSPEIVNGVSCISCHRHGIYPFPKDEIATQSRVSGELLDFVQRLHDSQRMDQLKANDRDRFLIALEKATGKWFRSQTEVNSAVTTFAEPITRVASHYNNSALGLAEVASELGIDDQNKLQAKINNNQRLKDIGLEPLSNGGVIKRDFWQGKPEGQSPFQQAARHVGAGVPITVIQPRVKGR
jgi:serine/threonine-protein kinase